VLSTGIGGYAAVRLRRYLHSLMAFAGAISNITVVKPKNNETTWSVQFKDDGSIDKRITYDRGNM